MSILKVVEILADSKKGWEDATANAVKKASKSAYRVNVKITFEVK